VDVFVRIVGSQSEVVVLELDGVRLRDSTGSERDLPLVHSTVESSRASSAALAGGSVEPARYETLVLSVRSASIRSPAGRAALALLGPGERGSAEPGAETEGAVAYEIPIQIVVRSRQAASLFLSWDVDASVIDRSGFQPVFTTAVETARPTLGTVYVTDAAAGSVVSLDRASGAVVATNKVGAGPAGIATSTGRRLLYVANADDGSLSVVDIRQETNTSAIPVRLGADTCDVVVADPPDIVATANRGVDTVTFFDVRRLVRLGDVRVGRAPVRLVPAPRQRRLFCVDSRSDTLSVLDINTQAVVATIPVEAAPVDASIDRRQRELFVGHRTAQNLLVIDAARLNVVDSIYVGGNELAVVDRRLKTVIRRIPISGVVESLVQPLEGPYVYGAAPELGALVVVNVITGREEPSLPCGTRPSDVAVVD
jgi:YVTN family beta-propeller protein